MAYAGIQTMLLAYKMRKCDKEFELMQISQERMTATRQASGFVEDFNAKKNEFAEQYGKDSPEYLDEVDDLVDEHNLQLAEIAEWEDKLDQQQSNCETEISMLNGYINSWQAALQQNIAKSHTYGAQ